MKRKGIIFALVAVVIACAVLLVPRYLRQREQVDWVWNRLKDGDVSVMESGNFAQCKDSAQLKKKILSFVEDTDDAQKLAKMGDTLSQVEYTNGAVKNALTEKLQEVLPRHKSSAGEYLRILARISEAKDGYFDLEAIVPQQEFTAYLTEQFAGAVIQKGAGGYYDAEKNKTQQYTNELMYTITESHSYFGDFYLHDYDSKAYRPTGERWEDEQMKAYDEKTLKLYCSGALLDCPDSFTGEFPGYAYGAESAYVREDCVVVVRNGKYYTSQGNILYNRQVSPYEEVAIHAAAICIPEAAYDEAGSAAMWFFSDNKDLFPLLDAQQITQLMPGKWTFYYLHAGELPVDFRTDGTYTEHYKSSDPTYPWGVEKDLFCQRKSKDGSWQIRYEVRQITEELYMLYEPGSSVDIAIKKVG